MTASELQIIVDDVQDSIVYERHYLSEIWGDTTRIEFDALSNDIAENGLHNDIVIYDNQVLDGWHRYLSCLVSDVRPRFKQFEGDLKAARRFVCSQNRFRRHIDSLSELVRITMRAMEFNPKDVKQGRPSIESEQPTVSEIADLVGVSDSTVSRVIASDKDKQDPQRVVDRAEREQERKDEEARVARAQIEAEILAGQNSPPVTDLNSIVPDAPQVATPDAHLDDSNAGMAYRIAQLEERLRALQRNYDQLSAEDKNEKLVQLQNENNALEVSARSLADRANQLERQNKTMERKIKAIRVAAQDQDMGRIIDLL